MAAMAEEQKPQLQVPIEVASSRPSQPYYRLSTPDPHRIAFATMVAVGTGAILGASRGGKIEALRFRAENAHRLPKNTKGWYLYHKSKNYAVMYTGIKEGAKFAGKMGLYVGLFFITETLIDRKWNKSKDFRSTTAAGLASGLVWSRIHRMSIQATGRMLLLGFKAGLSFGLLQDAMGYLRGHEPEYLKLFSFPKKNQEAP